MTITKTRLEGGTFDSVLTVFPVFRFVRRYDNEQKVLDVGASPLPSDVIEKLTLRSSNSSWVHFAPEKLTIKGLNDNFVPGVRHINGIGREGDIARIDDDFDEDAPSCVHPVSAPPACPPAETKVNTPTTRKTFDVRGSTLAAVVRELNKREEWGRTRWTRRCDSLSCRGRVYSVTITVRITIELPRWTKLSQVGPNTRAEWVRMLQALTAHENNHVAIIRRHFNVALATSMLNQTDQRVQELCNRAHANARAASDAYDSATSHGQTEGVYLDTSIRD
jgi:predicted secreted Zn-dependent protease